MRTLSFSRGGSHAAYVESPTKPGGVLPSGNEEPADTLFGRDANRSRTMVIEAPTESKPFQVK
jgi:hypothetical protein